MKLYKTSLCEANFAKLITSGIIKVIDTASYDMLLPEVTGKYFSFLCWGNHNFLENPTRWNLSVICNAVNVHILHKWKVGFFEFNRIHNSMVIFFRGLAQSSIKRCQLL